MSAAADLQAFHSHARMCAPVHGQTANVCSRLCAGLQALQLRAAQAQHKDAREQLKRDLQAAEASLLRGTAPSTLALQPALRMPFVPSAGAGGGAVSSQTSCTGVSEISSAFCVLGESEDSPH